jgi:hypothetical protein
LLPGTDFIGIGFPAALSLPTIRSQSYHGFLFWVFPTKAALLPIQVTVILSPLPVILSAAKDLFHLT